MRRTPGLVATGIALAVMAIASVWAYGSLPEQVVTHFDATGNPDGWSSRTEAVLFIPLVALGVALIIALVPLLEPRRHNLERSAKPYNAVWIGTMALFTILHLGLLFGSGGATLPVHQLIMVASGGLLLVLGNYLPKVRSTWLMGIRTPWTLSSEKSWTRTHRLGSRLFAAHGLLVIIAGLLIPSAAVWVLLAGSAVVTAWLAAYSYLVWRDDPDRAPNGSTTAG